MDTLQLDFREAMAHVSAPVTVITTTVDGVPHGSTVSAFASLSITPPMVFLALDNRGSLVDRIRSTRRFGVNVLAADQAAVAMRFATPGIPDRFEGLAWHDDHGLPRLDQTVAWLRCDDVTFAAGGDHTVLLGTVAAAATTPRDSLTYYLRQFGSAGAAISSGDAQ